MFNYLKMIFESIDLTLSFLSIIVSTLLTIVIFAYQISQDRKIKKLQRDIEQKEISEKAKEFIIHNIEELDYLPFCIFASNLNALKKHKRKIYKEYCLCSPEVQKEILRIENINVWLPRENQWIEAAMGMLVKDIEKHTLGKNVLYDSAKYFHRGFERYKEEKWNNIESEYIFEPIAYDIGFVYKRLYDIEGYIDEYMHYKYSEHRPLIIKSSPIPPIDYVWELKSLGCATEDEVCAWIMEIVYAISQNMCSSNYIRRTHTEHMIKETDAVIETYEDKYYQAVQALYNAYYCDVKNLK